VTVRQPTEAPGDRAGKTGGGRLIAAGIAVVLLVAASRYYDLPGLLARAMDWVAAQGLAGVAAYILLYVWPASSSCPGPS